MKDIRQLIALALVLVAAMAALPPARTSKPSDATAPRYHFVFVVNRIGARPDSLARARDALAVFVDETLTADDRAMVVEIGESTRVLHDFSSSKEATIAAIKGIGFIRVLTPPDEATRQFYDSLRWVGETLQEFPERSFVVLASNEPNRMRQAELYMEDAVDALRKSFASVYSIDLGLLHSSAPRYGVSGLATLSMETGGTYFQTQSRVSFTTALRQLTAVIQRLDVSR